MSGEKQKTDMKIDTEALLKAALFEELKAERQKTNEAEEAAAKAHVFSPDFTASIKALIEEAGQTDESGQTGESKQTEKSKQADVIGQEELLQAKKKREERIAQAEAAQETMNEKILPSLQKKLRQRALMSAASFLLLFGFGFFAVNQTGLFSGSGAAASAKASVTEAAAPQAISEAGAAAPQAISETGAGAAPSEMIAETKAESQMSAYDMYDSDSSVQEEAEGVSGSSGMGRMALANPIEDVADENAFKAALGLSLTAEASGHSDYSYSIIGGQLAQIRYQCAALGSEVTLRAAQEDASGTDDGAAGISGVYETFDEARELHVTVETLTDAAAGEAEVKLQLSDSDGTRQYALATWNVDGVTYSLWMPEIAAAGGDAEKAEQLAVSETEDIVRLQTAEAVNGAQ